jgi:acetolactate synthase I/II/III large subunit
MSANNSSISGGEAVVEALLAHAVAHVFCVPGESYLAVLDALHDARDAIEVIACRHESGATIMACSNARLRGRAGVCMVTRGPGATNASIGLHIARQASIPLVVIVGQVAREQLGREAFQEVDYEAFFAPLVKHVEQVDDAKDVADAMRRAFACAEGGRPGPVVLALPEDVLVERSKRVPARVQAAIPKTIGRDELGALQRRLVRSERPLIIAGGGIWSDAAAAALVAFAATNDMPVCTAFRRHDLFDNEHRCFAGYLGYGAHDEVWDLAAESDCVLVIGARLDEPTTRGYTLFRDDHERQFVHIYPSADEIGLNYAVDVPIVADISAAAEQLRDGGRIVANNVKPWCARLRDAWCAAATPPPSDAPLDPGTVMALLNARLPDDAIVTVDAGNFSRWPQRYRRYRRPGRLLAPINGAMGFGVPAAVGAALTYPQRQVVGCVGDGGMLMTGQELATAAQYGARPLILVFNNCRYGTIEMHQDQRYPGRRIATALQNPDFAAFAQSFGLFGAQVNCTSQFAATLDLALAAPTAAVIELQIDGY